MKIDKISFEEISSIWVSSLWKDRQSPIKPMSSMVCLGGYDMSIYNNVPTFFAIKDIDKIVAVNSGHMTINGYYRSRGLWVNEEYRNKGLTYLLFTALFHQAKFEGAKFVWSLPRDNSVGAYIKNGFHIVGNLTNDFELGPHYYVSKSVG
jgi:hypothetical protein